MKPFWAAALAVAALTVPAGPISGTQTREPHPRKPAEAIALGEARWREGNFQSAFDWISDALELARRTGSIGDECRCLTRLGRLSWALGKPEDSRKYYEEALAEAGRGGLHEPARESRVGLRILDLYDSAKSERAAGRLAGSVSRLEEAVKWSQRLGSPEHEVKCLRQLSLSCLSQALRERFLGLNRRALGIARGMKDRSEQAKCLLNLGSYDFSAKEYSRALNEYSEAADLSREIGNREDELACLKNIATILMELGFYERAVDTFQSVYSRDRLSENDFITLDMNQLGQALKHKGLLLSSRRDVLKSVGFFEETIDKAKSQEDNSTQLLSLDNLGLACLELGYPHTALHYLGEAFLISQTKNDVKSTISILSNIGKCKLEMGTPQSALGYFEKALDLSSRSQTYSDLWEILFYLGQIQERLGRYDQALTYYRNALDVIDFVRSRLRLDEYKTGFARNKAKVYESLASLLFKQKGYGQSPSAEAEIFAVIEKAKARAFLETLSEDSNHRSEPEASGLRSQEDVLSGEIADLISRTSRNDLARQQKLELEAELGEKEEEYLRLLSRNQAEPKGRGTLTSPLPVEAADVQLRLVDDKTAVLEYFLRKELSLLVLVTKNKLKIIELPARDSLDRSLSAYISLLSEPSAKGWNGLPAGRRLAAALLSRAIGLLPSGIEDLIIIPDGALTGLPFETLPLPQASSGGPDNYLISRYSVSYGASCSSLLFLKGRERKGPFSKGLLAMGDPLYARRTPTERNSRLSEARLMQDLYESQGFRLDTLARTRTEARRIAALFPENKADVYLKGEASVSRLKSLPLKTYQVIHLACHAYEDEQVPFRSGLFLSIQEGGGDDGFIYARDVADLRMRADLVVLSACRTSKGYIEDGEGVMGLARAFFYAGARSVVSSLWEVSDRATAEFMPEFYRHLMSGETKSQALRSAKLEMLNSGYAHPFYWAAFVLAGDPYGRIDEVKVWD